MQRKRLDLDVQDEITQGTLHEQAILTHWASKPKFVHGHVFVERQYSDAQESRSSLLWWVVSGPTPRRTHVRFVYTIIEMLLGMNVEIFVLAVSFWDASISIDVSHGRLIQLQKRCVHAITLPCAYPYTLLCLSREC